MNITKKRLLEIEKELNSVTIHGLQALSNVSQWRDNNPSSVMDLKTKQHHCPHCNRSGIGWGWKSRHFDNCRMKGIDLEEFTKDCNTLPSFKITEKYGVDFYFITRYRRYFGIEAVATTGKTYNLKIRTCPHCNRPGKGNIFSLSHFDNCKFKGIDLTQLNEDILNYDDSIVQSKYGLTGNPYNAYKKYHKIRKENYLVRGKRQGVLHHWSVSPRDSKGRAISKQK